MRLIEFRHLCSKFLKLNEWIELQRHEKIKSIRGYFSDFRLFRKI